MSKCTHSKIVEITADANRHWVCVDCYQIFTTPQLAAIRLKVVPLDDVCLAPDDARALKAGAGLLLRILSTIGDSREWVIGPLKRAVAKL